MRDPKASAWARPFLGDESEPESARAATAHETLIAIQQGARVSLDYHNARTLLFWRGFLLCLLVAMLPWFPSPIHYAAFIGALVLGSIAISHYMKASRCRLEINASPEDFL